MWQYICGHNSGKPLWILIILHIWKREWIPSASGYLLVYFTRDVNMTSLARSWHWRAATASDACVARFEQSLTNGQYTCVHVFIGGHFEHILWLSICFFLYLMNFMFHTTLDAVGSILKVHYKSMKCGVSLLQGSLSTLCDMNMFFMYV